MRQPDYYGIFFEDINLCDGELMGKYFETEASEDSVYRRVILQQEDGIHVKTVSGWLDEFCNGEGLCRWVKGDEYPNQNAGMVLIANAKMELELTKSLNEHRNEQLSVCQFEKDGSVANLSCTGCIP